MTVRASFVAVWVSLCGLGAPGLASGEGIQLGIIPLQTVVAPGDTFEVDLTITEAGPEFNAFDINVGFDPARVAFVPVSPVSWQLGPLMTGACANLFHVFTPETSQLRISLSLLCANTFVTGPGVVYRVKFRALPGTGETTFSCNAGTQFYRAGFFVNPLVCEPGSVLVDDGLIGIEQTADPRMSGLRLAIPAPNPSRGWGIIGFTLPNMEWARLELYDASGRLVAERPERRFASAGRFMEGWDVSALPSGVYLVRLVTSSGETASTRWTLLR